MTPTMPTKTPNIPPHFPCVLALAEKSGPVYFHVPNMDTLLSVALAVLKARMAAGWYQDPEGDGAPRPMVPDYTDPAEIATLRGGARTNAERQMERYQEAKRRYDVEVFQYKRIIQAVKDRDGYKAWELLKARSGGEYEDLDLETYVNAATYST